MADLLVCLFYMLTAHVLSLIPTAVFLLIPAKSSLLQFKWRFFRCLLASLILLPLVFTIAFSLPLSRVDKSRVNALLTSEINYKLQIGQNTPGDQTLQPYSPGEISLTTIRSITGTAHSLNNHGLVKGLLLFWLASLFTGAIRFFFKFQKQERLLNRLRLCSSERTYQNIRVYVSHHIRGAFCRSWPCREIYIPVRQWADEKLRYTILVHESLHLAKQHPGTLLLARFLSHLFQLNPLLHFAARQGEELSEYICDFHGTQVIPPKDYLTQLLRSAEQKLPQGSFLPLSTPWLKQGELKKRVKMILTPHQEDTMKLNKTNWLIAIAAMIVTLLGVSLACGTNISLMAQDIHSLENEAAQVQGSIEQAIETVELEKENRPTENVSFLFPIDEPGRITLAFGETTHPLKGGPYFHKGVDIAWSIGYPVKAALSGKVGETGYEPEARGHYMIIIHDSGYEVLYSHLDTIDVSEGTMVHKGQIVAKMGNSGLSTGPHLHFEIHNPAGESVDPLSFFPERQSKSDHS